MISVQNVSHRIGSQQILTNISLHLEAGKTHALIGPNGAGKSTLLSLIARLIPLQEGQISIGAHRLGKTPDRLLAQALAILPQSEEIVPRLTLREMISFGRYPYHQGHPGPEDRSKVEAALEKFDLAPLAHRRLDEVSGGQRQKALVAMAYVQDTPYLLLDEPLNNLDIAAARSLMTLLRDLSEQDGKTIVIVLHDINYASAYADQIIALADGHIRAQGTPASVLNKALLQDVFKTNADVVQIDGLPRVLV